MNARTVLRALCRPLRHRRAETRADRPTSAMASDNSSSTFGNAPPRALVWPGEAASPPPWARTPTPAAARAALPPRRGVDHSRAIRPHRLDFQPAPAEPVQPQQGRLIDRYPTGLGYIELGPNAGGTR